MKASRAQARTMVNLETLATAVRELAEAVARVEAKVDAMARQPQPPVKVKKDAP